MFLTSLPVAAAPECATATLCNAWTARGDAIILTPFFLNADALLAQWNIYFREMGVIREVEES